MSRTPFTLAISFSLALTVPAVAGPDGPFSRGPRLDEAKARVLVETLKSDPDEKKRKAAADKLGAADPRACPDVAPALVAALRRDASAAVRVEAAEALRGLGEVFAQAGVALEEAGESDPSPLVRLAAKRTLWEYYLQGYRAAKGGEGALAQTLEPPIASPAGPRPVVAFVPAAPVPVVAARVPPIGLPPAPQLPPVVSQPVPQPGPRLVWPNVLPGPRVAVRSLFESPRAMPAAPLSLPLPVGNGTPEPPLAKKGAPPVSATPPAPSPEPPLKAAPVADYTPTLPPFQPDLPSVVTPPWATALPVPKFGPPPR